MPPPPKKERKLLLQSWGNWSPDQSSNDHQKVWKTKQNRKTPFCSGESHAKCQPVGVKAFLSKLQVLIQKPRERHWPQYKVLLMGLIHIVDFAFDGSITVHRNTNYLRCWGTDSTETQPKYFSIFSRCPIYFPNSVHSSINKAINKNWLFKEGSGLYAIFRLLLIIPKHAISPCLFWSKMCIFCFIGFF